MADYILGALLALAIGFALRHIYRNMISGRSDCCGEDRFGCCEKGCTCAKSAKRT